MVVKKPYKLVSYELMFIEIENSGTSVCDVIYIIRVDGSSHTTITRLKIIFRFFPTECIFVNSRRNQKLFNSRFVRVRAGRRRRVYIRVYLYNYENSFENVFKYLKKKPCDKILILPLFWTHTCASSWMKQKLFYITVRQCTRRESLTRQAIVQR